MKARREEKVKEEEMEGGWIGRKRLGGRSGMKEEEEEVRWAQEREREAKEEG